MHPKALPFRVLLEIITFKFMEGQIGYWRKREKYLGMKKKRKGRRIGFIGYEEDRRVVGGFDGG